MIRVAMSYDIEEVENLLKPFIMEHLHEKKNKKDRIEFEGYQICKNSDRYKTFFTKGYKCSLCGIEGKYFALEKNTEKEKTFHFNLYAIDENGEEVLMTKDHIIPKSKGGKDVVENYTTMCKKCNEIKGSNDVREIIKITDKWRKYRNEM